MGEATVWIAIVSLLAAFNVQKANDELDHVAHELLFADGLIR